MDTESEPSIIRFVRVTDADLSRVDWLSRNDAEPEWMVQPKRPTLGNNIEVHSPALHTYVEKKQENRGSRQKCLDGTRRHSLRMQTCSNLGHSAQWLQATSTLHPKPLQSIGHLPQDDGKMHRLPALRNLA